MTEQHDRGQTVSQARLDANWRAIEIELDAPRPAGVERALRRIGVPSHMTRLAVATPALRRSWYLAVIGVVVVGLATADAAAPRQSVLTLLTLAPLVPVLGVALAYGSASDGQHEMHLATPTSGIRLVATRTIVVLVAATFVITPLALINAVTRPYAAAWLLPALAVTATTLALATRLPPRRAALTATGAWTVTVSISQIGTDPLLAFTPVAQLVALVVAIVGAVVTVIRREHFERLAVHP